MGTIIDMIAIARPLFNFSSRGSIFLSTRASKLCIKEAGIDPKDIGLIINTGIYRHRNTGEPAIAAIIQKKILKKYKKKKNTGKNQVEDKNTFSFDLSNGGCGWLTGIEIANGYIQNGSIRYGMIITGDSEPFKGSSENFNFETAAAAIILSKSDDSRGFSQFRSYSFSQFDSELVSDTHFGHIKGKWGKTNILSIRQSDTYLNLCIECAEKSLTAFLKETGLSLYEIDLLISSQSPEGFISGLKERIGLKPDFVYVNRSGNKEFHTAGPAIALKKTWDDNRFKTSKNIIFITVGAGINVSIALYKN